MTSKASEEAITVAVLNGDFTEIMEENAAVNGATSLVHAKASAAPVYLVPTAAPTSVPTPKPSLPPVRLPTESPTYIFKNPTPMPTVRPSKQPGVPTRLPTYQVSTAFAVSQVMFLGSKFDVL
jgi:cell division septation protein DedD